MKAIYSSANEEEGFRQLEFFKDKWNSLYPIGIKSWYDNWDVLSQFFSFSDNVRKVMYTTNIIENLNRQYRKVTKGKAVFPSDKVLTKSLFLATEDATKKWTMPVRAWANILMNLIIYFDERVNIRT
jgi:transposase-like protein